MDLPDHSFPEPEEFEDKEDVLTKRHRHVNRILSHFWSRWKREYLMELRNSHQYHVTTNKERIAIGDVVLIHDDKHPRGFWKTGVVEELMPGRDGVVRAATLRVGKKGQASRLRRPIQRLYPLEVKASDTSNGQDPETTDTNTQPPDKDNQSEQTQQVPRQRPLRQVAERARSRWIQLHEDEL